MFKKTIKFRDFNDVEHTQDFYFHVSKADLIALGVGAEEMQARIQSIVAARDGKGILKEMRDFVELGAGIRSEDGSQFNQSPEIKASFMSSPACDELLVELCTNASAAVEFITSLLPQKVIEELAAQATANQSDTPAPLQERIQPNWLAEGRMPTKEEIRNSTPEQLQAAFRASNK